jgi:hypothetical protein
LNLLFGQPESVTLPTPIYESGRRISEELAKKQVEGRTKQRIESALDMHEECGRVRDPIKQPYTGICRR